MFFTCSRRSSQHKSSRKLASKTREERRILEVHHDLLQFGLSLQHRRHLTDITEKCFNNIDEKNDAAP